MIGGRHGRVDGPDQVSGAALFTADLPMPGALTALLLRSPHAHARILSIDVAPALALEGVEAVITGADLPTPYGVIPWTPDEHALALHTVRYVGDAVACVAALDERSAQAALEAIVVCYEPLEPLVDPAATAERMDLLIHEGSKRGNLTKEVELGFGDLEAAFEGAEVIIEGDYGFQGTTHAALEPHAAMAQRGPDGVLTVWTATQVPHYVHRELARVLDLPARQIRVVQPPVGGGFGGKSEPFELEFCVAKLALLTGRPVRLVYSREEVFLAHRGRHPMHMKTRTAFDEEGRIRGHELDVLLDGGAYASFGLVTTYYAGQLCTVPWAMDAYSFRSRRVYTNKPACGPKRGHGSVQPRFALEVQLDKAARALQIDPIELRRRAFGGEHTRTVNELRVGSLGLLACLDRVQEASGWRERWGKLGRGRGLGVAASAYISGTNYPIYPNEMPQSAVQICADRSGRVRLFSGAADIGQGSSTVLATIVAEELGVALGDVRIVSGDTDLTPVDLGSYSSRVTLMAGHAAQRACRDVASKVRKAVAERWGCSPKDVSLADREAIRVSAPAERLPIAEAFQLAEARFGTLGAVGHYNTPREGIHGSYRGGAIGASPALSCTAHIAEVSVDEELGLVNVERIWCAHDCGRALVPTLVEGQIHGACHMGLGEVLLEEHRVLEGGLLEAADLLDYRVPSILDSPPVDALLVEAPDEHGPYGAKEAGEGPLHSVIPAIANAIFDAIGVRLDHLPITPDKVLAALDAQGKP